MDDYWVGSILKPDSNKGTDWTVKSLKKFLGVSSKDRDQVGKWVDFPDNQKIILKIVSAEEKDNGFRCHARVFLVFDLGKDKEYYVDAQNLEKGIIRETVNGMKRVKLPIPEEYGGGWATGGSVKDAVDNLIKRIKEITNQPKSNTISFAECAEKLCKEDE